jgi:GxxExxY protein
MLNDNLEKNKINLVYPELSYKIIGALYDVFNNLGYGHKENYYQKAVAVALRELNIGFKEQVYFPLKFKDLIVGKYFFDFLIDNKIVLEIKANDRFSRKNIEQTYSYLKVSGLKLGILANFTNDKVKFKRIVNLL